MCGVSAAADDYVPLVRNGVQWVNQREHYNSYQDYLNGPPAKWYYTYEIKGDTTVNGRLYKKCHYYLGENPDRSKDSIAALLREQDSVVYCRNNGWNAYVGDAKGEERVLYDFKNPPSNNYGTPTADSILVNGTWRLRLHYGEVNDFLIIEGVGFDSNSYGDLLYPFKPIPTGFTTEPLLDKVYLWYVKENGQIVYRGISTIKDGVENVGVDSVPLGDEAYYNLQGARVAADRLTPGIYIHNHKKVVVR